MKDGLVAHLKETASPPRRFDQVYASSGLFYLIPPTVRATSEYYNTITCRVLGGGGVISVL